MLNRMLDKRPWSRAIELQSEVYGSAQATAQEADEIASLRLQEPTRMAVRKAEESALTFGEAQKI